MSSDPLARYATWCNPTTLITEIGNLLNVSTVVANHVTLDGNGLDTTGSGGSATLLLNGVSIATNNGIASTIGNWALYQAISTVTYATGGGSGGTVLMSNGIFSNVSTNTASVNALSISTLNGQTVSQLGQTLAYRPTSYLSSQSFQSATTPSILLTSFSNAVGKTVGGTLNMTLGGYAGVSNTSGNPAYMGIFVSDNNTAPYLPNSALGGTQIADWYLFGPAPINGAATVPDNEVNLGFAFSNAGSQLYVIAQGNTSFGAINWGAGGANSISTNMLAIYGGGTPLLV